MLLTGQSSDASVQIDVHYSLPRDEDKPNRRVDKDKHQGTVRIVLQDTRNSIREADLDQMFRGFGAIKGIYHTGGDPARYAIKIVNRM